MKDRHIYPILDKLVTREIRSQILNQQSRVLWFTGLSGSGKSTIAIALERKLLSEGYFVYVLDGDNIRTGLNAGLSFSQEDRNENIRRIAEVGKLFVHSGVIVISSFISPTIEIREKAKNIIGADDFLEIFIDTPIEICEQRDVKGLYKKARKGEIKNFTGIDAPYEAPTDPYLSVQTEDQSVEESVDFIFKHIIEKISLRDEL
jgi:adenylylsulfate kinase